EFEEWNSVKSSPRFLASLGNSDRVTNKHCCSSAGTKQTRPQTNKMRHKKQTAPLVPMRSTGRVPGDASGGRGRLSLSLSLSVSLCLSLSLSVSLCLSLCLSLSVSLSLSLSHTHTHTRAHT